MTTTDNKPLNIMLHLICMLCADQLKASPIIEELSYKPEQAVHWQARVQNIKNIEAYLQRNVQMNVVEMRQLQDLIQDHQLIHNMSRHAQLKFFNAGSDLPIEQRYLLDRSSYKFSQLLERLPSLKTTSYTSVRMNPEVIDQVVIGSVYTEPGFLSTNGSLHKAHQWATQGSLLPSEKVAIIKVEGINSKPISFLKLNEGAAMVFPQKSQFRVIHTSFDATQDKYFMHIKEITPTSCTASTR